MSRSPQLAAGAVVDDAYIIEGFLGSGSMAEVYAAHDLQLERSVAVKISQPSVPSRYLQDEGRLLASLRHPGVVAAHRLGTHQGRAYLVLERLVGTTLEAHLRLRRGRRFELGFALELLVQLADAVAFIHRHGVLHRDLKPANVMITPTRRLVLFDLGVGLEPERAVGPIERVVGSPHYMAPEIVGDQQPPGVAQDIYALGCVAFELLTGDVPYDGESVEDVLAAHAHTPVPPLGDDVNPLLGDIIERMLAKSPEERPASAEVVASWLRGVQRGRLERQRDGVVSVLIADDDSDIRALLSSLVERRLENVTVDTAVDGVAALTQLSERPIDVLLLDLDMPRLSGVELCMHLASMPETEHLSLCVFSSCIGRPERELLGRLGVKRFIDKSAPPDVIVEGIESLVKAARERRHAHDLAGLSS